MNKAAQLQNQVKQNNTDLTDFLKDLTRWEEQVKDEDNNLKSERRLEEKLPPVRSKVKNPKVSLAHKESKKNDEEKKTRISSYDYDGWSKYDVDAACESASEEESADSEEEVENAEELDKIRQQRALQKSVMEKEKGNQLFKEGKYNAAIDRYTSAISLNQHNPVLYANRGMALLKTEKYASAEQDCDVALQLDPLYGKAIARRGTARKKLKKYREALQDFTHLLEIEPKNQQAISESKELKKILMKNEEVSKSSVDKLKNVKIDDKETFKKTRRSGKALKRIHITEVGIDEPEKQNNEKVAPKNNCVPQVKNYAPTKPNICIPSTSFMFETEFKKLKKDTEQLYIYIKLIPLSDYSKLFYQCIDTLISPFVNILKECYVRDNIPYHEELDTFSCLQRFDMALMFLPHKDNEVLKYLLNNLSSPSYEWPLQDGIVEKLATKYNIKL